MITLILNILFLVFLVVGFLFGLKRGMKRTLVRSVWLTLIIMCMILLSINITSALLKIEFITFTYNGQQCANIHEFLLAMFKDILPVEGANYDGLIDIGMFLMTILLSGIVFLVLYWIAKLVTLPMYWITNRFIFAKERRSKKLAKKEHRKVKIKKHRLIGGLIGVVIGFVSFCMTVTPIMGYINIVKIVEKETSNSEGNGIVSTGFSEYTELINSYNNSIPVKVIETIYADKVIYAVFDGLTSSKINGTKVTLSEEAVNISRIYNELDKIGTPDINTISQDEMATTLDNSEALVNAVFDSKFISATSDVVIPIAAKYVRQSIDTTEFKPYVLEFYNVLFDEIEKFNSASTKQELINIIGLIKTLNSNNLLLPIIQNPDSLTINHLKTNLTKEASDQIVADLFKINTVNNVAPALVNFLLGFGAEQLEYEYSGENAVTSLALKQSVEIMMDSVVDLLGYYDEEKSTKVEINSTTVSAFGAMLDEIKNILSTENFESVVNAIEPKLDKMAEETFSGNPEFIKSTASEAISNISEITNYKTAFVNIYNAYETIKNEFEESKVDGNYDVQYMDFVKIGSSLDDIQNSGLFKNDLMLRTMSDAVKHYSDKFEKDISTESKPFSFTLDSKIISNIDELKGSGVIWKNEFPKYKNTMGIFLNLFQNEGSVIDKIKSDSDTSLQDLGYELDNGLDDSVLLKDCSRLLVADLLSIADIKVNESNDEGLTTLLGDAKANVLNESVDIVWENEFIHIKELLKLELDDSGDDNLRVISKSIDNIVFGSNISGKTIPGSTIFTQDIINKYISDYMDKVFTDVDQESDFYTTIQQIKTSFNTKDISSYSNEIDALLKLKEVKTLTEAEGFDFKTGTPAGAVALGQKIDSALMVDSVVVDKALVNDFIAKKIDGYFDSYSSDMAQEIETIKEGFNDDIVKYEAEFTSLLNLMKVSDKTNEEGLNFKEKEDAMALGASIDTALSKTTIGGSDYSSTIVTHDLINGYIKRYLSDSSKVDIDANNEFGDIITTITGTKSGDTFGSGRLDDMVIYDGVDGVEGNIYQKEFGYLSQLIIVTEAFTNITITNIGATNTTLNSTLADQFDGNSEENERVKVLDPLRNSYLVGDSLLVAIDDALETYTADNTVEFGEILVEVNSNYSTDGGVRDNVLWMGKLTGIFDYTMLIDSFIQLNDILENSSITADITSVSELTLAVTKEYDDTLALLQGDGETSIGNILFLTNGTNKLAKFALEKIKRILEEDITTFESQIAYINAYIKFLGGYFKVDDQTKRNVKYYYLPYADSSELWYTYLENEMEQMWGLTDTSVAGTTIQVNTPFQFISSQLNP